MLSEEAMNEADVEVQQLVPCLVAAEKLAIPLPDIKSKKVITPKMIGKGGKKTNYIPDFLVYKQALPVLVVEAKRPGKPVEHAYAEARLYATEINVHFKHGLNPCSVVLATDGERLLAGRWDEQPSVDCRVEDLLVGTEDLLRLQVIAGNSQLEDLGKKASEGLRSERFKRPFNQGSGAAQIISKVDPNSFAADLAPILRRYFSSHEDSSDEEIYSRAYISSNEVTGYDRILESYLKDRLARSKKLTQINTTKKRADEFSGALQDYINEGRSSGQLQLVTGGVGAGKSLFARRYKEHLQPAEMKERNHWAFLNFNDAPDNPGEWPDWVCSTFLASLQAEGSPLNLRDAAQQEQVFAANLAEREAYYSRMESASPGRGMLEMARDLEAWRQDPRVACKAIARFIQGDCSENLVVVFDNVDRRDTHSQLSAFQTALWFMSQTRCFVILQMRDSTFEAYKDEPPLDTYKTGQVFHISPPRFIDVVKRRLELSLNTLSVEAPELVRFQTRSGVTFQYPKKRATEFLRGIYLELFQSSKNSSKVLEALAGRNVRRALDMFLALLTSGHIPEETIMNVAQGRGYSAIPEYRILRALMRQDYKFFNDESGFVSNIFYTNNNWVRPSNLLLPSILFHLHSIRKVRGDNGQMGFVALERLLQEMEFLGFVRSDTQDAVKYAVRRELIELDTLSLREVRATDCLKATASGWAHMRILSERIEYIASILPTTSIDDDQLSDQIFDGMQTELRVGNPTLSRMTSLATSFLQYLRRQHSAQLAFPGYAHLNGGGGSYVIGKVEAALSFHRMQQATAQPDLLDQ